MPTISYFPIFCGFIRSFAGPEASLSFLFWGAGLFVLPVIAIYTIGVYWIFRGKTRKGY